MNITSRPFGPIASVGVHRLPSTPGRLKSGALQPKSHTGVVRETMARSAELLDNTGIIAMMSSPRFYLDQPLAPGARFSLPPGPARPAARALRLAGDDTGILFNGRGGGYTARLERIHKEEV